MSRVRPFAIVVVLAVAVVSGCGSPRGLVESELASCTGCHGGHDNETGAPPAGVYGGTGPAIGAHTVHVDAGVACGSCHVVPTRVGEPSHPSGGRAEITFGGLAVAGSAEDRDRTGPPQFDPVTYTCSSVYCHGGTLDAGGSNTAPSWGQALPSCGTCHSFPPPSHVNFLNKGLTCSTCHALSVEADNFTLKPTHLDGTLNFNFR